MEDVCVLCDREEEEDVSHFVSKCEEFAMDLCRMLESVLVGEIVSTDKWLEEYIDRDEENRVYSIAAGNEAG